MNTLSSHLWITGLLMAGLSVLNALASKHFGWPEQLNKLDTLTRNIFIVHHLFIWLLISMLAVLMLFFTHLLIEPSGAAAAILLGLAIFWGFRLVAQWWVYEWSLWQGNRFRTGAQVVLTAGWIYLTSIYTWGFVLQIQMLQGGD